MPSMSEPEIRRAYVSREHARIFTEGDLVLWISLGGEGSYMLLEYLRFWAWSWIFNLARNLILLRCKIRGRS